MSTPTTTIPQGTWSIDPIHSEVSFSVKHLGLARVRGTFAKFTGEIVTGQTLTDSSITAEIDAASLDTGSQQRDEHVRSGDFFDVENHPTLVFRSTSIEPDGEEYLVHGEASWRGHTVPVTLRAEVNGVGPNPAYDNATTLGVSAETTVNRRDFGVGGEGNAMISEKAKLTLEVEGTLQS